MAPRSESLEGQIPTGLWSLYVLDDSSSGFSGSLGGWDVNLVTVNPVNSAADIGVTLSNPSSSPFAGQNFQLHAERDQAGVLRHCD